MSDRSDRIATVAGTDSIELQSLLAAVAAEWCADGVNVTGLIAESHGLPQRACSAGILREINSGRPHTIYLDVSPGDTSCHLDASGVDGACKSILDRIATSDLVILSKFGKLEASGSGLAKAFKAAMAAGKPILTTVSAKHRSAWQVFAPGAIDLSPDKAALQRWWGEIAAG
jgi:hypothetical protein